MAKKKSTGKSRPQTALREKLESIYEDAYLCEEKYIGDLIKERGYTIDEIARELGHKPHKMFVDIVMQDIDRTVAFEYHGEQHYSLVGNMTKTTADLMLNQQLDQEKSWILTRIAIPLVAVPFDMYVDERVIENLIDEAYEEMESGLSGLTQCPECDRLFPQSQLSQGICDACWHRIHDGEEEERQEAENDFKAAIEEKRKAARSEYAERRKEEQKRRRQEAKERQKEEKARQAATAFEAYDDEDEPEYDDSIEDSYVGYDDESYDEPAWKRYTGDDDEYTERQKEYAKQARKEAYQRYKQSPQYAEQKERARKMRKEAYEKRKAEMKRRRGK